MPKIYYKVVSRRQDFDGQGIRKLGSARAYGWMAGVEYKVGEYVQSPHFGGNSRLFLFTDLQSAKGFAWSNEEIYEAHAIGVTKILPVEAGDNTNTFWEKVAQMFKRRKKVVTPAGYQRCQINPATCVTAKRVKLVKLVE